MIILTAFQRLLKAVRVSQFSFKIKNDIIKNLVCVNRILDLKQNQILKISKIINKKDMFKTSGAYSTEMHIAQATEFYNAKESAIRDIRERHHEAANVIEKSINTILNDSMDDGGATENSEALRKADNDLNSLLQ